MIICETARISVTFLGMGVLVGMPEHGLLHVHFYGARKLYTLFEELTGARFTTYTRIEEARDVPEGWLTGF